MQTFDKPIIPTDWSGRQVIGDYKPGIYFDMPANIYHSLPYFSNSSSELMRQHPSLFWHNSVFNPNKPEQDLTPALIFGTAFHSKILEPEKFEKTYVAKPNKEQYEAAGYSQVIEGTSELKAFIKANGGKGYSALKKKELLQVAECYSDGSVCFFDKILDDFNALTSNGDSICLTDDQHSRLDAMKYSVEQNEHFQEYYRNGYPEVVIIWIDQETGILCKAMVDWLSIYGIMDLKTFTHNRKKTLHGSVADSITDNRYFRQFAVYTDALEVAIKDACELDYQKHHWLLIEGLKKQLSESRTGLNFRLVFVQSDEPHIVVVRDANKGGDGKNEGTRNTYYTRGIGELWREQLLKYSYYLNEFGVNKKWVDFDDYKKMNDQDLPRVLFG